MKIPISSISPNPKQPRKQFDEEALQQLANSLAEYGQVQAVTVEERPEGNYWLISGERRWRAAQLLGWSEIEATVMPSLNGKGDQGRLMLALVENTHREDMNPIELAQAYQELHDTGLSDRAIGELLGGKSAGNINLYRNLLRFSPEEQALFRDRQLPLDSSLTPLMIRIKPEKRTKIMARWAEKGMTVREIKTSLKKMGITSRRRRKLRKPPKNHVVEGSNVPSIRLGAVGGFPWQPAFDAAVKTCKACDFFTDRADEICKACPCVVMVRHMTSAKNP